MRKGAVLRKSMKKMKGIRIWSVACAMLLAVSCLATMVFVGTAAEPDIYTAQSEYVCRIESDPTTDTPPYASAGVTGGFGDLDSNGRVWVDKSVSANDASNAFDVSLSALAQEYSYSESVIEIILEQNAADVLFVLDFSSSMTNSMDGSTRIKVLASSLNDAMKKIMEANPNNRIMAVAFDAGSYDFLPLGSYGANTAGNYVEYDSGTKGIKMASGATKDGAAATYSLPLGSGTHMQIGITYGCNELIQAMSAGYGDGKRMPFVMVMTDGSSSYSNDNWAGYNLSNQNNQSNQIEANSTLAATFWKKRLIDAYNTKNAANGFTDEVGAVWFDIGMGIADPTNAASASRQQVSLKPEFASPDVTSTSSAAYNIYKNILTRLEKAYNNPEYYIDDPMNGYDDILARAGVDISELREAVDEATEQAIESTAIQAAALETGIRQAGDRDTYTSDDNWYAGVKSEFGIDHGSRTYKNDKNNTQYKKDVAAAIEKKVKEDVDALVQGAIDEAVENAISRVTFDNPTLVSDMNNAVLDYFNEFVRDYMGYDGATQAERQANYAANPMHGFAEYVNYADTATKVEGSFTELANLIAAATQGTVIPITHKETTGIGEDEIFITFTDVLGEGTELQKDEDGNFALSIDLQDSITKEINTYVSRPKTGAENTYEFYKDDKTLKSTVTINGNKLVWEVNAYELPIIRFLNRMKPTDGVDGKYFEDPDLPPIVLNYEVVPTASALANTSSSDAFIYQHDDVASAPAFAEFTPNRENTYYFTEVTPPTETTPGVYAKKTSIEETIAKEKNPTDTAAYATDVAWGTGDDENDILIKLGNDARTKVLAAVSIEDDRMEDGDGIVAHTYNTDETITYTLKVKNLSDEKLEDLTYTLDVTPSGPATTDTPSALTVGTCSTTPDSTVKTGNKQTLTFTIDELAAGATETVTVPMTPVAGTKNGVTVDAVITLTKVYNAALVTPATDEVGEVLVAENATVYTYLDGAKTNLTGISGAPTTLYIKKTGGDYIALTKDTATATYIATNIPIGEYTIYDGNSGTPKALGAVSVSKGGDNEGNLYWKTLTLAKVWDDNNNQDGKRTDVTLTLYRALGSGDPVKVDDYALTSADAVTGNTNQWQKKYVVIAKDANGNDYTFTLEELEANVPSGYTASVSGLTITNKHTPETASVTLTKKWADGSNQDAKRPASVKLTLYKQPEGGTKSAVETYTITGTGNEWTKTVENLPKYEGGKLITYTVDELTANVPTGYAKSVSGFVVTNTYTPEVTSATLKKVWNDNSNQDGKRPTNVTLTLYKQVEGGEKTKVDDVTFNGTGNEWTKTVENLPKYEGGKLITYTADELTANVPTDYTKESASGLVVTNKHTPETTSVTLKKVWADNYNQDGKRTENVTLTLYKQIEGGIKTKVNDYTYTDIGSEWVKTVENLPKYESGKLITYTADETTVPTGYIKSVDGLTVTNTHTPETVSVTLKKVWDDNADQDGKRPATMQLMLLKKVGTTTSIVNKYDLSGTGNEWTKTIDNLPKYQEGVEITYLADEDNNAMPSGYAKDAVNGLAVTNKHVPEVKTISGTKTWDDADYVGKTGYTRPTVTVNLTATVDGVKVDALCKTTTATAATNWEYAFYDMPVYQGGKTVLYTVSEAAVDGFTPTVTGDDIKNTPVDKDEVLNPITLTVKKADSRTLTGKGIKGAVFTLTNEGGTDTTYETGDDGTVDVTFAATGTYTLKETIAPTGYTLDPANTYTIVVNKDFVKVELNDAKSLWHWNYNLSYVLTDVLDGVLLVKDAPIMAEKTTLTKAWDDNKNQDGVRPTSVTFGLYKTVNGVTSKVQDVTLSGDATAESWTKDVENLPTYEDGYAVTYTIDEDETALGDDYSKKSVDNDTLTITNSHKPGVTSATLKKVWADEDDADEIRPATVTLALYKTVNGVTAKVDEYTFGGEGNEWTKKVENLPKFENGFAVIYTADETTVPTGYEKTADGLTVTNTHDVSRDITVTVENGESDAGDKATVTYGEDKTVTFTATEGYVLDTVTVDGEVAVLTDGKYTFTDVTDDHEIVVKYAADDNHDGIPDKYQATVTYKVVNGTWADGDADPIDELFTMKEYVGGVWNDLNPTLGDTVPTGMKPDDTHKAPGAWDKTCDADVAVVDGDVFTYTFDNHLTHTVTVIVEGGTSDVEGGTATVIHKDDKTVVFTPDEGKVILSVVIDGEEVKITDDLTYTFTDVTDDHEIKVTFADDKNGNGVPDIFEVQVTYQVENGTWADGTTDDIVENVVLKELKDGAWTDTNPTLGDTIPTGMTPDEYYTDTGKWNTEITADTAVTTNVTYRYTFGDEKTHTVTIEIENGTTDPNQGSFPVKHKDDQDVKITPDEHYVIDKILVDGEEVEIPEDGTLHFTDIVTDHDIQVICEEDANDDMIADKYQAKVAIDIDKDAGEATGDGIYWKGETATVTATPHDGYVFIGWMVDGRIVSEDPTYTFTADVNVKLTAVFEKAETPTEAPTTKPTTEPTLPPEAPKTGDTLPSAALMLAALAAGVLVMARKRENEE